MRITVCRLVLQCSSLALALVGPAPRVLAEETRTVVELLASIEARLADLEKRLAVLESRPAQPAETDLALRVEGLEQGLKAAEAEVASAKTASAPELPHPDNPSYLPSRGYAEQLHYGDPNSRIEVHAFVDLEFIDAQRQGQRNGVSTFDNHHANIFVRSWLRPNLLGFIEAEFEHGGEVVEIDQAFMSWRIDKAFNLDIGRIYGPFGIERFVSYSPTNALVSRPSPLQRIVPNNFYQNGLKVWGLLGDGESSRFSYEASVSDGLGDAALANRRGSRQFRDNNTNKAVTARASYAYWPFFEIGASYHDQQYATSRDLDLSFIGLDLAARFRGVEVRAEWVEAEVERDLSAGGIFTRLPDREEQGYYLQLAYAWSFARDFLPQVVAVGRFDSVDLDRASEGQNDRETLALGLNLKLYEHFRFKAEYQWNDEKGLPLEDDAFLMQFVIDY